VARGEREVVDHAQVREEIELLEHDPDPLADRGHVDSPARDLFALEEDPTGVERLEQVDAAQQRALPTAARPDHHEHLTRGDAQVDVAQHHEVSEALGHLLEAHHWLRRG